MSISLIGFTDIDRTLIFHRHVCVGENIEVACAKPGGEATHYMDERHQRMLLMLRQCEMLIPTTARNTELFKRVKLEFQPGWAILSYGGIIRDPQGEIHQPYLSFVRADVQTAKDDLKRIAQWTNSTYDKVEGFRNRLIEDAGMPFYFEASTHQVDPTSSFRAEYLAALQEQLPAGWQIRSNSNNILVCPAYLSKENAVAWFLKNIAPANRVTIGFGDSDGDLPFMRLCDYIFVPNHSQVAEHLNK